MASRQALVVPALRRHTATVIVAHGLGDSGAGWVGLAENLRRRGKFEEVKFIFPDAPTIPITVNFGMRMPGWYDITDFTSLSQAHDEQGILSSRETFKRLIQNEVDGGIPSTRIVLGGFSQGGAMALFTGATIQTKLGGVFGLSSYLLMHNKIKEFAAEANGVNKDTPFFMGHGDSDPLIKHDWGVQTAEALKSELGHTNLEFKTYRDLDHSADPDEIDDLETFIKKCLPPVEDNPASGL